VRIVSINLNRRLGARKPAELFQAWLKKWQPHFVLGQEPKRSCGEPVELRGYEIVVNSGLTIAWVRQGLPIPAFVQGSNRWQMIDLGSALVHHVYLSPYSSKERRLALLDLARAITRGKPTVVIGDFNLAPAPQDGWYGDQISQWTTPSERSALNQLLEAGRLVDSTSVNCFERQEFTFERVQDNRRVRFRCDLALVAADIRGQVKAHYDHSVRTGPDGFTDHSAIIMELCVQGRLPNN
jgi:exonuclease III